MSQILPSLGANYRALVIGATGTIGAALVTQLLADPACAGVTGLSRADGFDLVDEASISRHAQRLTGQGLS